MAGENAGVRLSKVHKPVKLAAEGLRHAEVIWCARQVEIKAFGVGVEGNVREGACNPTPCVKVALRVEVPAIMHAHGVNLAEAGEILDHKRDEVRVLRKREVVGTGRNASGPKITALLSIAHGATSQRTGAGVTLDKVFVSKIVIGRDAKTDDVIGAGALRLLEFLILIPFTVVRLDVRHRCTPSPDRRAWVDYTGEPPKAQAK